jgi:RNA polymerase sigma factor (TIGR02999 family)
MTIDPGGATDPAQPDAATIDRMVPVLYQRLHELAHLRLRRAPAEHSLNTTGLLHEAYLRLADASDLQFDNQDHFLAIASRVMRNVLVDHARARVSAKRGGGRVPLALESDLAVTEVDLDGVLDLDDALGKLKAVDERQSRIVECRYFGGLSLEETASALNLSLATVKRDLRLARAWLAAEMTRESSDGRHRS